MEKIDALVGAWLPGTEGQGITDVIFGDHGLKGLGFRLKRIEQLDQSELLELVQSDPLFPLGWLWKQGQFT